MSESVFDLKEAILSNDHLPEVSNRTTTHATNSAKPIIRRRPSPVRRTAVRHAPAPVERPLLQDRGFITYQYGGAIAALVLMLGVMGFIFYLNVRFSVLFMQSLGFSLASCLIMQLVVAVGEQHLPRLKRFFYKLNSHDLWKAARWVVWPFLFGFILFDVYSTAAGLRLEILQRFLADAEPTRQAAFASNPVYNTVWTLGGGIIALVPEPLTVIVLLATVRMIRNRRRAIAIK